MTGASAARAFAEDAVGRFISATEHERLVLYRMHLQATVRSISPFTLAFAEHVGVDLEEGMDSIRPPSQWPWRPQPQTLAQSLAHRSRSARHHVNSKHWAVHAMLQRYVTDHGFVHFGEGKDMLLFDVDGPWLSMHGRIGECSVRVVAGTAALTLPAGFPETLGGAMVGRPVDAVVDNPALTGRGYRVKRVREATVGAGPTLVFSTGRCRFTMPWPELIGPVLAGTVCEHVLATKAGRRGRAATVGLQRPAESGAGA